MEKEKYGNRIIDIISKHYSYKHEIYEKLKFIPEEMDVIESINDIKYGITYQENNRIFKFGVHIGQRKLLLNEIQFLTNIKNNYQSKLDNKTIYCVYAGSAPGNKTYFLSKMFPSFKFILVDPNPFKIFLEKNVSHRWIKHKDIIHMSVSPKNKTFSNIWKDINKDRDKETILKFITDTNYRLYLFEELMTNDLAFIFKELNAFFISDIRTNYNETSPSDLDIYWNNSMMFNWITIMNPPLSMLKFRSLFKNDILINESKDIPYFMKKDFNYSKDNGIDFLKSIKDSNLIMPKGRLLIQPWAPKSSTELRLIIKKKNLKNFITYDSKILENRLLFYNSILRTLIKHKNPNYNAKLNFCYCNDCALENKILTDYGMNKKEVHEFIKNIDYLTMRSLKKKHTINIKKSFDKDIVKLIKYMSLSYYDNSKVNR